MSEPDKNPTDDKVKRLRERTLDLVADAAVHVQRLDGVAKQLGLTPDLVDGLGDYLYEAAVAQLEVASKVLERSQGIADRLLELAGQRLATTRFARIDAQAGDPARFDFVIRNPSDHVATVEVEIEAADSQPQAQVGQRQLPGRRETAVEIQLATAASDAGRVFAMVIRVYLVYERGRRVELAPHELELWVRA